MNVLVHDIIDNNTMRDDNAICKHVIPVSLSMMGPNINFPNAIAHVDIVSTCAIIC